MTRKLPGWFSCGWPVRSWCGSVEPERRIPQRIRSMAVTERLGGRAGAEKGVAGKPVPRSYAPMNPPPSLNVRRFLETPLETLRAFHFDAVAELDFGSYRILNARRVEISDAPGTWTPQVTHTPPNFPPNSPQNFRPFTRPRGPPPALVGRILPLLGGIPLADRIRCASISPVRTTLDIDEDVLLAAKELAAKERKSTGKVVSDLVRQGILAGKKPPPRTAGQAYRMKNGIPVLPSRGEVVTTAQIRQLMDAEGI